MSKIFVFFFIIFLFDVSFSQEKILEKELLKKDFTNDSVRVKSNDFVSSNGSKNLINNYLIIDFKSDTTYVDTTLSIKKDYKYNYLRKDNFNLIQFANTGQTYNTLSSDFSSNKSLPLFAAQARHFNYLEIEDINYYRVPTPLTELYYKTVFSQGQNLDSFFTVNISPQLNFSLAYKGLRSLGNYQNSLTSTGNFRFTTNYHTKNGRYNMRGHITMQDLFNEENGGLTDDDVIRFINGDDDIQDRSVFDPNFENAESILDGKRFHFEQSYFLLTKKDTTQNSFLSLENTISFQDKFFQFNQTQAANDFFGSSFNNTIDDSVTLEEFYTDLGLTYYNNSLGKFNFKINYNTVNYGYDSVVFLNDQLISNRIKENFFGFNGSYDNTIGRFKINGSFGVNLSETIKGSFLNVNTTVEPIKGIFLIGGLNINNSLPNYNQLLYQSDYVNYNWDNVNNFDLVSTQQVSMRILSDKYINATFDVTNIDNFTYFNLESTQGNINEIKPIQYNKSIQYFRIKIQKELKFGNFALDNTILFQNVTSDDDVLNIPSFITRNSLYYSDQVFNNALEFQTGIIFNYFSEYNGNGYDPLLSEFYTQNETTIGGFPRLDLFVNAKIRQTRIFIKAEHLNSSTTGNNFFSAPNFPYRDFTIRFGLVWNFFL